MTTDDIMALVESYRTAGGREEHWAKQDHLCNAIDQLVNENRSLRYEVDAIAAIKEERDVLQASLVEAHTTYQAKLLSYEALLIQVAEALEPYADIKPRDWKTDREKLWWAYDAIVERLK